MKHAIISGLVCLVSLFCTPCMASAVTISNNTTIAAGNATYDGQDLVVDACTVTINGPHAFASFQLVNGAVLTHSAATSGQTNNQVNLAVAGDVLVDASSKVDAEGKGYAADSGPGAGQPGTSGGLGGGGGHGGNGSEGAGYGGAGGTAYGSATAPATPGSGGGATATYPPWAAEGGGVVRIDAGGTLQVDGAIVADGFGAEDGYYGGGSGAGGSIWLSASNFTGSGTLSARGGNPWGSRGVGAGGRIAVYYDVSGFLGNITAAGGAGTVNGGAGTVYLKEVSEAYGELVVDNAMATNGCASTPLVGIAPCRATIRSNAIALVDGSVELASLEVHNTAQITHMAELSSGAAIDVLGDALIATGGIVDVSGKGYAADAGPGAGQPGTSGGHGGGGGHGGMGGNGVVPGGTGGTTYGSVVEPTTLGSGGGASPVFQGTGAPGGGAFHLAVGGTLQLDGEIIADGFGAADGDYGGGGGAGGSVWLSGSNFTGSGSVSVLGGNPGSNRGAGGGGRIAVHYQSDSFAGVLDARGGLSSSDGGAGTVFLMDTDESYGTIMVNNEARTNSPAATWMDSAPVADLVLQSNVLFIAGESLLLNNLEVRDTATITHAEESAGGHITVLGNALVAAGGAFDMHAKGYGSASGTGQGGHVGDGIRGYGSGAGHGAAGGAARYGEDTAPGGRAYGSETAPVGLGSGGGAHLNVVGGTGGGAIRLTVGGTLTMDGSLSADATGGEGGGNVSSGGGSGGSIYLAASVLAGSGSISAKGGNAYVVGDPTEEGPGGGAGGRIALYVGDSSGYSGGIFADGGTAEHAGGDGTIHWGGTNALPTLAVIGHSPTGTLLGPVASVDVRFENAVASSSFSSSDVLVQTPGGTLSTGVVSVAPLGGDLYRISFPSQTVAGAYQFSIGPNIDDLFGNSMGGVDTVGFSLRDAYLSGTVSASNGWRLAGVVVSSGDGFADGSTGTNGAYQLSLPLGWSGTIGSTLAGAEFAPGSVAVGSLTNDMAGIDFVLATPLEPKAGIASSNSNVQLEWTSISNLYYQLQESTNLAEWVDLGLVRFGQGSSLSTNVPVDPASDTKFFRVQVSQ